MKEFRFTFLTEKDLPVLHQTFLKAFSDYLVPIQLDWPQFTAKLKREGIDPAFCVAAYAGGEMAGFILTGLGEWQGRPTAYNAGTGVVPQYRGHGLTKWLYEFMLPKLQQAGVEQCLLEVIKENQPALKIYKDVRFSVTRTLDCFRSPKQELLLTAEEPGDVVVSATKRPDWKVYRHFWDVEPTWQNTSAALSHSPDDKVVLEARGQENELLGYIALFTKNGAIAQLAVDRSSRGKGIGTMLLREAAKATESPYLMLINIDTAGADFLSYLERRHFVRILMQYEMLRTFV